MWILWILSSKVIRTLSGPEKKGDPPNPLIGNPEKLAEAEALLQPIWDGKRTISEVFGNPEEDEKPVKMKNFESVRLRTDGLQEDMASAQFHIRELISNKIQTKKEIEKVQLQPLEMQGDIGRLESRNADVDARLTILQHAAKADIQRLRNRLANVESENAAIRAEIDNTREENKRLKLLAEAATERSDRMEAAISEIFLRLPKYHEESADYDEESVNDENDTPGPVPQHVLDLADEQDSSEHVYRTTSENQHYSRTGMNFNTGKGKRAENAVNSNFYQGARRNHRQSEQSCRAHRGDAQNQDDHHREYHAERRQAKRSP